MGEGVIVAGILEALSYVPTVYAWRNNSGVRGGVRFGKKGSADILGVISPFGMFLAIECKTPEGLMSKDQYEFAHEIQRRGGLYIVARTVEQGLAPIRRVIDGIQKPPHDDDRDGASRDRRPDLARAVRGR